MADYQRIQRQQTLRQAEGYLDLVTLFADQWPLSAPVRDALANRALEQLERLGERAERQAHVAFLRGHAFRCMQQYPEAIEHLQRSAELDPENIHVWLALGWCYKRSARLDLAIQSLEEALAVDDSEAILHYNLACYWSLAFNVPAAIEYLTNAFDINPNYRDLVANEKDFDPIRNEPEFQAVATVIV